MGKLSKSADVYSFGVTLWEIFTGGSPYKGFLKRSLGHLIVFQNKRPSWPDTTPLDYKDLAERCWQPKAQDRPSFDFIVQELTRMRASVMERSKPLDAILARGPVNVQTSSQEGPSALGVAVHASTEAEDDEWTPTIMEGPPTGPRAATFAPAVLPRQALESSPSAPTVLRLSDLISATISNKGKP